MVRTKYGTLQLKHEGHLFNRHVQREGIVYYRCTQYAPLKCRARLKIRNGVMSELTTVHNHPIYNGPRKYGTLKQIKQEMSQGEQILEYNDD